MEPINTEFIESLWQDLPVWDKPKVVPLKSGGTATILHTTFTMMNLLSGSVAVFPSEDRISVHLSEDAMAACEHGWKTFLAQRPTSVYAMCGECENGAEAVQGSF